MYLREAYGWPVIRHIMEQFEVKRGLIKKIDEEGGLSNVATKYFDNITNTENKGIEGNYGILTHVNAYYSDEGKLVVNVEQLKGQDLDDFLSKENGRDEAMESRRRWSGFLDYATGYSGKQRGDKAKENAKKASKAKNGISSARHFMKMSKNLSDEKISQAEAMIEDIEHELEKANNTRAHSLSNKLKKLLEG